MERRNIKAVKVYALELMNRELHFVREKSNRDFCHEQFTEYRNRGVISSSAKVKTSIEAMGKGKETN